MKILIMSDIHANADAMKAILDKAGPCDAIYCAGDLVDYGPQPCEVLDLVKEYGIRCVIGNHDPIVIDRYFSKEARDLPDGELKWSDICCRQMNDSQIEFLRSLPRFLEFEADGISYLMTHRTGNGYELPENRFQYRKFWRSCADELPAGPHRLILGHTHRQYITDLGDGDVYMNPGSVSYRRMDDPEKCAQAMLITDGNIEMIRLEYDRSGLAETTRNLKDKLKGDEYYVGNFFFILREEDGLD